MKVAAFIPNESPLDPRSKQMTLCHTFPYRSLSACVKPNPKWRPKERVDGYGRLHDIPSQEMSRLADYFAVAGIDRDSKNG